MTRFVTLASTGLFAAGLAILPVSVFAQPSATTTAPAATSTQTTVKSDSKVTAPVVHKDASKDAGKDVGKTEVGKTTATTKTAPVNSQAKTGTHG